eukprot:TRINITY_DN2026_c0_g1_i4.p1 TRINITY_DN2026_c0_g1~~TRINITY_DN2026_c0_g1_i4.p1  ORF type:complete len:241 (-),score=47.35 TRINITY_DN2026_c0_g1_i4:11-685(-)
MCIRDSFLSLNRAYRTIWMEQVQRASFTTGSKDLVDNIFKFWFSPERSKYWFKSTPENDKIVGENLKELFEQAVEGKLDYLKEDPKGALALVLLLDQVPRNIFRNDAKSYETDHLALEITKNALEKGWDKELGEDERLFLLLPLMHSEKLEDQELNVKLTAKDKNADFAAYHRDLIVQFGRFPGRNEALGRISSPEELEYLKNCLLYTSTSPRDRQKSRMPSSA